MILNGGGIENQIQSIINGSSIPAYARTFAKQNEGASWKERSGMYYYENADTTAMDLPFPNVMVFTFYRSDDSHSRGVAFALRWQSYDSSSSTVTMWTNGCHDDTGSEKWSGWKAITPATYSLSGTKLTITTK